MLKRLGCGCIYLVTDEQGTKGRCVSFCAGDGDPYMLGIEKDLASACTWPLSTTEMLSAADADLIFNRLSEQIHKGYRLDVVRSILKTL